MNSWFVIAAVVWFGSVEYIRGRPSVSARTSLALMFLAPIGTLVIIVLGFVL